MPNEVPWGKLHVPGLARADNEEREHPYATFPYYCENNQTISQADDVVAMAVIVMEGLWADTNRRDDWHNHIKMP